MLMPCNHCMCASMLHAIIHSRPAMIDHPIDIPDLSPRDPVSPNGPHCHFVETPLDESQSTYLPYPMLALAKLDPWT